MVNMGLTVRLTFDAAHFLKAYEGKCAKLHGHSWQVVFVFRALQPPSGYLPGIGMFQDFGPLKQALKDILPDHECLNSYIPMFNQDGGYNPTAENLAIYLFSQGVKVLQVPMKEGLMPLWLHRVEVWESPNACAWYEEA
jgi:6-pyruvoyltetrahydropterin/6-carboxytetrahydropterin synthase